MTKYSGWEEPDMNPKELPSGNFQSSLPKTEGPTVFGTTRYGDARDDVFYQPARPIPVERPNRPETTPQPNRKDLYKRIAVTLSGILLAAEVVPGVVNQIQNEKDLSLDALGRDAAYAPKMYWNFGKTTAEDILRLLKRPEVVIPTTFDPKALQGVFGENNTIKMTPEEYKKVETPVLENSILNIPLAVRFKDDKIRTSTIEIGKDKILQKNIVVTINGLKEGDTLLSPVDGEIEASYSPSTQNPDGSLPFAAFFIDFKDTQGNKMSLTYSTVGIKPLIKFKSSLEKKGPPMQIKRGDPIAVLTTSATHQFYNGQVHITGLAPFIQRVTLATTSDGKVIVLQ